MKYKKKLLKNFQNIFKKIKLAKKKINLKK